MLVEKGNFRELGKDAIYTFSQLVLYGFLKHFLSKAKYHNGWHFLFSTSGKKIGKFSKTVCKKLHVVLKTYYFKKYILRNL